MYIENLNDKDEEEMTKKTLSNYCSQLYAQGIKYNCMNMYRSVIQI